MDTPRELLVTLLDEAAQYLEHLRDNTMDDADWPRVDALLTDIAAATTPEPSASIR